MKRFLLIFATFFLLAFTQGTEEDKRLSKRLDDDNSKFTNVGNLALTVTNFGVYGHAFSLWPDQPNCEYPIGSGIEHIYDGGIWIGGFKADNAEGSNLTGPFVTTGTTDPVNGESGVEFTNRAGELTVERSSLLESSFFQPSAISHQDFIADYADTSRTTLIGELIEGHTPLGVAVHQETYAWNYPFADFFVIMNYWIKNVSGKYLDSVYVGLWTDAVVRNTNITSPRIGTNFFNKGGNGFNDSLKMAYEFDATGDVGFTDSYIGIQLLGSSAHYDSLNYTCWQYRNTTDPNFFQPQNDFDRYKKLEGYFGGSNKYTSGIDPAKLKTPSNRSTMISAGPFFDIAPGDSINIVFAIVAAKKYGPDLPKYDTEEQKKNLYQNAGWAIRAYNGEDRNANGVLDPGEDLDANGEITRYILPAPPAAPKVHVVIESNKAQLYWDRSAESSIDPISGVKDFEGYRLYRTNAGFDLSGSIDLNNQMVEIAQFDSMGNDIGFNTGFASVLMDSPVYFDGDTTAYWYKFDFSNLLNGWQYEFSVTAFDEGDKINNLESLESSLLSNSKRIVPGTIAKDNSNIKIGVYPNPYYGEAYWDGSSERLRKIYFYNLPSECEITIYTLAGDVVARLQHDKNYNASENRWFQTFSKDGTQQFAGGEHAWDLVTDHDQAIATGLYLFSVKDYKSGEIKTGKFLVIK